MMAASAALAWALWLLLPSVGVGGAGPPPIQDGEFTFLLPAGRKQCFYQSAPANASLETEYQVKEPGPRSKRRQGRGRGQAPLARLALKIGGGAWERVMRGGDSAGSGRGESNGRRG